MTQPETITMTEQKEEAAIAIAREAGAVWPQDADRYRRYAAAALTTAHAEIEALKAERDKLAGIVQGWHYLAAGPDEMGDYYTHKQLVKASEPYASPALKALSERQP